MNAIYRILHHVNVIYFILLRPNLCSCYEIMLLYVTSLQFTLCEYELFYVNSILIIDILLVLVYKYFYIV